MYSEQLAVFLFIAAAQMATPGVTNQPTLRTPHNEAEKSVSLTQQQFPASHVTRQRSRIKQERAAMMLAQFY